MDIEKVYEKLNKKDADRDLLVLYLKDCAKDIQSNRENRLNIAYNIAGLLSTKYIQGLSEPDKIDDILTLAGELEIGSANDNDWKELLDMINDL